MGIIAFWPFSQRKTQRQPRCAIVIGSGRFRYYVTSDVYHQNHLQQLFGNRANSWDDDYRCPALLVPQVATARPESVAVRIADTTIGYFPLTGAREFLAALRAFGADRAACAAMVIGTWDPALGDHTHFRVRLDVEMPLNFFELSADSEARKLA